MAFEYVVVKEEFDLKDDAKTEVLAALEENEPDYNKDIKVDIAVPIPNNTRIKTEIEDPPCSPDSSQSNNEWLVPVKEEIDPDVRVKDEVDPAGYLQITVEVDDQQSENNKPASEGHASDDSAAEQATSSGNFELYHQTPSGKFACKICRKKYASSNNLQKHLLNHDKNSVKCEQCNGLFLNKIRLDSHIFHCHNVGPEKVFDCDECPKKFKTSTGLKLHNRNTHSANKPYECSTCSQRFASIIALNQHKSRSRCKDTSEPIVCKICDKVFKKEFLLKSHLRKHDTDKPFSCDKCSTTFKHKCTLIRHIRLHSGIRPYPCPHCGKTFTCSGLLKPHLRVHTGEKPYSCELCEKKFTHKHNMQRHMLRHDKIKHTVCDICHKEFSRESRLKYHLKTHVNEKYFICQVCPKRFSHKQNVLRHYTRKHPGHTFRCDDTDATIAAKIWDTVKNRYCDEEAEEILG